jgi:tetratricopeptide (TPR) repeat protein
MLDHDGMLAALLVLTSASGCEHRGEPQTEVTPRSEPQVVPRPRIELAGCRDVQGTTCYLAEHERWELLVWIDLHARAPLQVAVDGERIDPEQLAVEGGQRLTIPLSPTAELLEIDGVDPIWTQRFTLQIERESIPAPVTNAYSKFEAGDVEGARMELEANLDSLAGHERLAALQLLRQILGGWHDEALSRTEEAAQLAMQLGRTRDFADAAVHAAFIHMHVRGDLVAAREWTLRLEAEADNSDEARVLAHLYRSMLESRSGDLTTSLRSLDEAYRGARRLGMTEDFLAASELLGPALAELGRGSEALAVMRETLAYARSPELSCRERARMLGNVAWAHVLLAQAGLEHDPPAPLLDEQLAMVAEHGSCPDPNTAAFARVNLALASLAEDEPEEAWEQLGELLVHERPAYLEPWLDEIMAQVGANTGRWELLPPEVVRPDPGGDPGLRFSAVVRHASMLERIGSREAAIAHYLEAETILEETLSAVGIQVGSELFLAGRLASARGLVDLLIAEGRVDEALCRARIARGRALRRLDRAARIAALSDADLARHEELLFTHLGLRDRIEADRREDWRFSVAEREQRESHRRAQLVEAELTLDAALRLIGGDPQQRSLDCASLPSLAQGELMIMQFPSATGSWIFIADSERVTVTATSSPSLADDWTHAAFREQHERIGAATQIRVLPTGLGWAVPFHALPFADGVLLDVAPVVYSLDLTGRRAPESEASANANALVVADPSEDLPYARREAGSVDRALRDRGWTVERREGAEATRGALAEAMTRVELLHYAGHGVHAGNGGWEAALLLHEGDVLAISDILALPRVPAGVVLTGCDTATAATETVDGGMNLGRAFVLAGARWVIAADGRVEDTLAQTIGESLYQRDAGPSVLDGPAALREVALDLRREQPDGNWYAFRVFVP